MRDLLEKRRAVETSENLSRPDKYSGPAMKCNLQTKKAIKHCHCLSSCDSERKYIHKFINILVNCNFSYTNKLLVHLGAYQQEVDKGKLTAVGNFEKLTFRALALPTYAP